jgi:hypothetical protein
MDVGEQVYFKRVLTFVNNVGVFPSQVFKIILHSSKKLMTFFYANIGLANSYIKLINLAFHHKWVEK